MFHWAPAPSCHFRYSQFPSSSLRLGMGDYMASAFTPPMERELSPRLNDGTFRAFIHDVHHAYLLLHRAFQGLPPTVIPNIVPASPLGHSALDQSDPLRPASLPDAQDMVPSPSPPMEDDDVEPVPTTLGYDLPTHPVRHRTAPAEEEVPIPKSALSKSPLRVAPKPAPDCRRRSTGSHLDKTAKARDISRSRSPMGLDSLKVAPRAWATADLAKLRQLKQDSRARPNWKTVAGKLARSEDDCKRRWKQLQQEDAGK